MNRPRVVAIVPAHNEQERVAATVTALAGFCDEVIVVDDGSTDATSERAAQAGARTVRLARNLGKGAALRAGIAAATDADVFLFADADLAESAQSLSDLIPSVCDGRIDLAVAAPSPGAPSGMGLVESLSRRGIERLTGRRMVRPLSGQRAITAQTLALITIADGFGVETAMTIDALRAGQVVAEVPINFTHAKTGRDLAGWIHRGKQGASVLGVLIRRSLRRTLGRGTVRG